MHAFKYPSEHSDLFIYEINLAEGKIVYEVRDKETGRLLEPRNTTKIQLNPDKLIFDINRTLPRAVVEHIINTLTNV